MNTCGDCRFIRPIETQKGELGFVCKAHPPQIVAGAEVNGRIQVLSRWPVVRKSDSACGEWWGKE